MKQVKTAFYLLKSKTNKKGEAPVYVRVKYKGQSVNLSTDIFLKHDDWDKKKSRVKTKHDRSYILNKQLKDLEDKIYQIVDDINSKNVSLKNLKLRLRNKSDKVVSLIDLLP